MDRRSQSRREFLVAGAASVSAAANRPGGARQHKSYTAAEIGRVLESLAPLSSGNPGDRYGFIFGNPGITVTGIGCVWNAHTRSISAAARQNLNFLVTHEVIGLPYQKSPWYDLPEADQLKVNRMREDLLAKHGMCVFQIHSPWDARPDDGMPDQAVKALGIDGLKVVGRQKYFKVHELPQPMTVEKLKGYAAKNLGYEDSRIFGDRSKKILRFSFLIGGFGSNQWHMPEAAALMGAEALIIGEMSEFLLLEALELGMPVIQTLHSASEIPAVRRQAEILAGQFPGLPVQYIPSGARSFNP